MVILEAIGIQKRFGGVIALSNGNLKCKKGRITGLLGANGSGKSTLSKIITGVYSADGGKLKYNGKEIRYKNPHEAREDGIGMVFQNLSLVPDLNVWQNIVLGVEDQKGIFANNNKAKEISKNILDKLLPDLDIERKVRELNPGEMQIVEIAKAISANPKLLILDEPTAALEQVQVKNLFNYMKLLAEKGVAMIFTSHRMWEVMEICNDVVIFKDGENVGSIDFDIESKDEQKIIRYITGKTEELITKNNNNKINETIDKTRLKIKNLNYGKFLKDINFEVKKGEVLGIGGLAGQGQRELLLAIAGNYPEIQCDAEIDDKKIKLNKPIEAINNGIYLVPGDRQLEGLFLNKSVYFNIIYPKIALKEHPIFMPREKYKDVCNKIINKLLIKTDTIDTEVGNLSGGNQQKVVVGKWLTFDTNILLLDDPAKGVDVGAKKDLYKSIIEQVKQKKISVILYASDNDELIEYCNRVLVMYEGKIIESLEGEEIKKDKIIEVSMRVNSKRGDNND